MGISSSHLDRYAAAAVCGLLLLAVMAVFGQTFGHGFVNLDDDLYVCENQHVREGLTGTGIAWAFTQGRHGGLWIPLTWLSLMADAAARGPAEGPLGLARLAAQMHLVNVALHAVNAVLLFLVLRAMTASTWRSAMVAAVFAVHPLHVESVAWITERKDILSGLFGLLAIAAYAWYARAPSVVRYLSVAAALALGLMAKPILVTWPLLFLLLDYWPLGRMGAGSRERGAGGSKQAGHLGLLRLIVEKIPLVLLVAASSTVTFLMHRSWGAVISLESAPIPQRIARAAVLYVAYLGKTLWPANLAAIYPEGPVKSGWVALGAGLLLALLTAGALWGARRGQRWLAVGWFWYLGTLIPTIGLVQVGLQVTADRFLYLSQIGLCVALVWGAANVGRSWPYRRRLFAASAALAAAGLAVCAWQQTSYWRDSETLWTHALACTSENYIAQYKLGATLASSGRLDEAIIQFQKALELKPDDADAYLDLGAALARRGEVDGAIAHYRKALEFDPSYEKAHYDIGIALMGRGRIDEAIVHYRKALEIEPDDANAHNNLGAALAGRGRVEEAIVHYRRALELKPNDAEAYYNLGLALVGRRQVEEAIADYRKALEIRPGYVRAHLDLGLALIGRGEVDEAIAHFRKALELKPDNVHAQYDIAAALAGQGRIDEAIDHYRKALEINRDHVWSLNNLAWLRATHPDPRVRDGAEAVTLARRAADLTPRDPNSLGTLAAAYAEAGRYAEAARTAHQAVDLARQQNKPALAQSIQAKIRLYEAGKPFHEPPSAPAKTSIRH